MDANGPPPGHGAISKFAQLLGETIVHHAPWTADINERTKWAHTEKFLEGLESHTAGQVGPFLAKLLDLTDWPDELRPFLEEAIQPPQQFSAILEQIFLYGIVSNIIGTSVGPFIQGVSNDLNAAAVGTGIARPTEPATIATAVGRGLNLGDDPTVTVPDWAYHQAAQNGISKDDIDLACSIIGLPPAMQELFEMLRRGIISEDEVKTGLREGDFRDDWIDRAVQLAHGWLTPLDFVRAAVQDQMSYADAQTWAQRTGLDTGTNLPINVGDTEATPDMFGLAFSIAGRPPGPAELGRMANRKIIDWTGKGAGATTFEQGIAESDVKTKWTDSLRQLSVYVPPPREVGTLLEHGAITTDQAVKYWEAGGVPNELAQGYEFVATQQHIGQDKLLASGEVKAAYLEGIIDHQTALDLLGDLGIRGEVATYTLDLLDFRREWQAINRVVTRVSNLYAAHKLTATNAKDALVKVGVSDEQATDVLSRWDALRGEPIRVPSEAQIAKAVKYQTLTEAEALAELADLGYEPRDAAIVLSAEGEVQVTPLPPAGSTITT